MENNLAFIFNSKNAKKSLIKVNNSITINYSKKINVNKYCLTFENNNYSSLLFKFEGNYDIICYFKFIRSDGTVKFSGYHNLRNKEYELNIADCSKFQIIIPKHKNDEVASFLLLFSLHIKQK